jgi:hypothetical protein
MRVSRIKANNGQPQIIQRMPMPGGERTAFQPDTRCEWRFDLDAFCNGLRASNRICPATLCFPYHLLHRDV